MVRELNSAGEVAEAVNQSTLTVVDFYSDNCGPCRMIAPFLDALEKKYTEVKFTKVNVERHREVAASKGITAMPTFQLYRSGRKVGELRGANPQQLENLIKLHSEGEGSSSTPKAPYIPAGLHDISSSVDQTQLDCLNQKQDKDIKRMFKGEGSLESDVDEQLMLNIGFQQTVKLHSIKFNAVSIERAPKRVKLYCNRGALGFEAVDNVEATQELELTEADFAEDKATLLRFVKFQSVSNISIFVEDNQGGDDVTAIKSIQFIGSSVDHTDMKQLKKMGEA